MKTKIVVEILNIIVDSRYFSFEYKIWVNDELKGQRDYSDSHRWADDLDGWRKELENGVAMEYAIIQHFE